MVLTKDKFLSSINLKVLPSRKFYSPSTTDVFFALYPMSYQKRLKGVGEFKKTKLPAIWQFVCHYVIRSFSGIIEGTDNMGKKHLDIVWSIFTGNTVDYE